MSETQGLDIDSLPDMDESSGSRFIDLSGESRTTAEGLRVDEFSIKPDESYFTKCEFVRDKQKLWMKFAIDPTDIKYIAQRTGGLISAEVRDGEYCFDVESNPNGTEDIYYTGEYVGQYVEGEPRIYKRFFVKATFQVMAKQEIIIEHEPGQYSIHPDFFAGLDKMTQEILASTFKKKGTFSLNRDKAFDQARASSKPATGTADSTHLEML